MESQASQNNECVLGLELAEKGAHELQESFKSAMHGEDGDGDKEDGSDGNSNRNNGSDEDKGTEGNDDGGCVPVASGMAPGSST